MPTPIPGTSLVAVDIGSTSTDPQKPALLAALSKALAAVVQEETPESGDTVTMSTPGMPGLLEIQGSDDLAALTINFPDDAETYTAQTRLIVTSVALASTTFGPSGITIQGAPDSLGAGDTAKFQKIGPNTWVRTL